MTRQEAIEFVKEAFIAWESEYRVPHEDWTEAHKARDMAIEALEMWDTTCDFLESAKPMPSAEPVQPQEDLVSRQAAVEKILRNKDAKPLNESDYQDGIRAGLDIAYCEIRDLPSAEPVHGEWVDKDGELVCSVCGNSVSFSRTPKGWGLGRFCQTCGAKMDGGKNE